MMCPGKNRRRRRPAVLALVTLFSLGLGGCVGTDDAADSIGIEEEGAEPAEELVAAEDLRGSDKGVTFLYRGGTVIVDLSDASPGLRTQVIGKEVSLECDEADITRSWFPSAGEKLRFQLTREGADPGDIPTEIDNCSLSAVPGGPLAQAEMRSSG